jgi:hypothetical protein
MGNRLRGFVESVLFAGLKPDARASEAPRGRWLAQLRGRLERLLSGHAPTDPLYLTNRTWKQKLRLALIVGIPCVALAFAVGLALSDLFPHEPVAPREATPAEIMAKLLPDLEKTVKINANPDAELAEVRVVQGDAPRLSGMLSNKTTRAISIEFVLDLTDANGSRLGAVTERVDNIPARSAAPFDFVLKQPGAAFALVREVRTLR